MADTVFFVAATVVLGGALFYGVAIWFVERRNKRVLKRLLMQLREEDDDGEQE